MRETLGSIAPDRSSASPLKASRGSLTRCGVCRRLPETRGLMAAAELVAPLHDGVYYSDDYLGTLARAQVSSQVGRTFSSLPGRTMTPASACLPAPVT